jgi:hypothetical protein
MLNFHRPDRVQERHDDRTENGGGRFVLGIALDHVFERSRSILRTGRPQSSGTCGAGYHRPTITHQYRSYRPCRDTARSVYSTELQIAKDAVEAQNAANTATISSDVSSSRTRRC